MRGGVGMLDLFQRPGGGVESAPGVATGRQPGPPVADVLQAAGRQQAALEFVAVRGARGFADDPVGALDDAGRGAAQPGVVAGEAVMLAEHPEDPAVMLVVAAGFVAARAVEHALLGRERAGQPDRALVMQPGVQAISNTFIISMSSYSFSCVLSGRVNQLPSCGTRIRMGDDR